jgi:hypothetical protein
MEEQKAILKQLIKDRAEVCISIVTSAAFRKKHGKEPRFWLAYHNAKSKKSIKNAVTLCEQLGVTDGAAKCAFGVKNFTKVDENFPKLHVQFLFTFSKFVSPKSMVERSLDNGGNPSHPVPGGNIVEKYNESIKNRLWERLQRQIMDAVPIAESILESVLCRRATEIPAVSTCHDNGVTTLSITPKQAAATVDPLADNVDDLLVAIMGDTTDHAGSHTKIASQLNNVLEQPAPLNSPASCTPMHTPFPARTNHATPPAQIAVPNAIRHAADNQFISPTTRHKQTIHTFMDYVKGCRQDNIDPMLALPYAPCYS